MAGSSLYLQMERRAEAPTLKNLAPGEYLLTVTDAKGKSKATKAIIEDRRVEAVATPVKKGKCPWRCRR